MLKQHHPWKVDRVSFEKEIPSVTSTTVSPSPRQAASVHPDPGAFRRRWGLPFLFFVLMIAFALSLSLGSVRIPLREVVAALFGWESANPVWPRIIHLIRLPKALTAVLAGAALSASGLQMQTLFRNPLADSSVLGINAGASLGVALVVLSVSATGSVFLGLGLLGNLGLVAAASLGSATVLSVVLGVSRKVQSALTLLILGLMFGYVTGALVSLLIYFSIPEQVQAYLVWTFGSFGGVTWGQMKVMAPALLAGLVIAHALIKPMNALLLGEAYARSLGLSVKRARFWTLISASLLAGGTTAFCGPIAFLGLAVPHLCRSLFQTSDHRVLMPAVALMGGALALLADLAAQMPGGRTILPLNAVTSLIGAPVVIWVILRGRTHREALAP